MAAGGCGIPTAAGFSDVQVKVVGISSENVRTSLTMTFTNLQSRPLPVAPAYPSIRFRGHTYWPMAGSATASEVAADCSAAPGTCVAHGHLVKPPVSEATIIPLAPGADFRIDDWMFLLPRSACGQEVQVGVYPLREGVKVTLRCP